MGVKKQVSFSKEVSSCLFSSLFVTLLLFEVFDISEAGVLFNDEVFKFLDGVVNSLGDSFCDVLSMFSVFIVIFCLFEIKSRLEN